MRIQNYIQALLLFILFNPAKLLAQEATGNSVIPKGKYEYYLHISGIKAKADVKAIEKNIRSREGVTFFLGDRFPVRYFLLVSSVSISKEVFSSWLDKKLYTLDFYGEGADKKESVIMMSRKLNKTK